MGGKRQSSGGITGTVTITGDSNGPIGIGDRIVQVTHDSPDHPVEVTVAERTELRRAIETLRAQVATDAPPDKRDAALGQVDELLAALEAKKPDQTTLTTMEYVRNWFARHIPTLVGAVTGIVVNPIVGKLVAAAGDGLVGEFQRRFPGE